MADLDFLIFETSDAVQRANRTLTAVQLVVARALSEFELPIDYLITFRQILDNQVAEGICPPDFAEAVMSEIEGLVAMSRELGST